MLRGFSCLVAAFCIVGILIEGAWAFCLRFYIFRSRVLPRCTQQFIEFPIILDTAAINKDQLYLVLNSFLGFAKI